MQTFQTPPGRAGTDQLYGIRESINSHLERMFHQEARRRILEFGVGRTTSTSGGVDSKVQLDAQHRACDAAITFHAGKSLELAMQLVYAYGLDRIMGREYPGVPEKEIKKDVRKGHSLGRLYKRILTEMHDRDMESALEDAYQMALNRGMVDVLIDGEHSWSQVGTVEDIPFREHAKRYLADGMELTNDHSQVAELLFPPENQSEFAKMPSENFVQFLSKADAAYYEGDRQGNTGRRNMRWADYSARDHEYGRPYVVAGVTFFARLISELVGLANQQWIWHEDLALRWWDRSKYVIQQRLDGLAKQNFREEIDFPEMIPAKEARDSYKAFHVDPAQRIERGYSHFRGKWSFDKKE